MKFRYAVAWIAAGLSLCLPSTILWAQTGTQAAPATGQPAPTKPASAPHDSPKGQVIFSRSIDENGETTTQAGPAKPEVVAEPTAQNAERQSVTFTAFDLDVHLRVEVHQIAVRALLTVRNDGKVPLARIPLQISSSLNWDRIRLRGKNVAFPVAKLNSDADHTGQLHEAAVPLDHPLAPGESVQLDVTYSGAVAVSAQRLLAIGTPEDVAVHSDWDQIDTEFTGLRGFGSVVWIPVSSVPVFLGEGARLFDEMGEHKLRLAGAGFRLHLTIEFPHGQAPSLAVINGTPLELNITDTAGAGADIAGIATAKLDGSTLGFETPSLFVAIRKAHAGMNLTAWTLPDNEVSVQFWTAAAETVTPFLQGWLGQKPRAQLTLLDLPDPQDAPYETGALLVTSLHEADSGRLAGILAHALTHAWMESPRAWLSEGVAHFMGTLWIEKQQGRDKALSALESARPALALAEPESPGDAAGQPLARAISPVFYRTKGTYVLWMLRDIAGDPTLSAALRAYDPAKDLNDLSKDLNNGKGAGESSFEALLERAGTRADLSWFFADWVDADKGLPDLSIESVFPAPERAGNWLVAVSVSNAGYAAAEIPVTVRTGVTSVTQRVRVPARSKAVQRILIEGKPTEVQVNDGTVPESQASVHITKLDKSGDPGNGPAPGTSSQP